MMQDFIQQRRHRMDTRIDPVKGDVGGFPRQIEGVAEEIHVPLVREVMKGGHDRRAVDFIGRKIADQRHQGSLARADLPGELHLLSLAGRHLQL